MMVFISPAKTFSRKTILPKSNPIFERNAESLVKKLKKCTLHQLMDEMSISEALAHDVHGYVSHFHEERYAAIFLYDGQAFRGIHPLDMNENELTLLDRHLFILSGLYGLLRPMDGISKYRLEMNSRIIGNLVMYWKPKMTSYLMTYHPDETLFNLASDEYGKLLKGLPNLHTIDIEIYQDGKLKKNNMATKYYRGFLAKTLILSKVETKEQLKNITADGLLYDAHRSSSTHSIFIKHL